MRKLKKPEGSRILKVDVLLVSSKSEQKKKNEKENQRRESFILLVAFYIFVCFSVKNSKNFHPKKKTVRTYSEKKKMFLVKNSMENLKNLVYSHNF